MIEHSTLKKEGVQNIPTVDQAAQHVFPEDNILHSHHHKSPKSHKSKKHACNLLDDKNNVLVNCMLAVCMAVIVSVVIGNVETVLMIFQVL
jgi:hypothetical protein